MFRELCGDSTLRNLVLVTNVWGEVSQDVGEYREEELITNFFKPVAKRDAQLARHNSTPQSAHAVIRQIMRNRPTPLQIKRELADEAKDIAETAAGEVISKELNEQILRHQAELDVVKEIERAMEVQDVQTRRELEEEMQKLQEHSTERRWIWRPCQGTMMRRRWRMR